MFEQLHDGDVQEIICKYGGVKEQLLSILLDIQEASGRNYVTEGWAKIVAKELGLPLTQVHDVLTFYTMFSTNPRGRYVIEICNSSPCYVSKADEAVKFFEDVLGITIGNTTPDNMFTLMFTACVGSCDIGPIAKIGERVFGNLTRRGVEEIITSYQGVAACQK